jgi:iron complex outermembrane receptor protein
VTLFRVNPQDANHHQFSQELQLLGTCSVTGSNTSPARTTSRRKLTRSTITTPGAFFITHRVVDASNDSYALFANATYHMTPKFDLTVGGRYSDDSRDAASSAPTTPFPIRSRRSAVVVRRIGSKSWSRFNPSASVSYQVNDDINHLCQGGDGLSRGRVRNRLADEGRTLNEASIPRK